MPIHSVCHRFKKAFASLLLFLGLVWNSPSRAASPPPNFVIIVADDLGYGDLGCYGSKTIATPRLDRMAAEGVRFTDAYAAAPFCSPSRAALLTGRLPARCGVPYVLFPAERHGLSPQEITMAELLRGTGYQCAAVGKWHLGWEPPFRPTNQGFTDFFGLPYSNDSTEWPVGEPFTQVMGLQPLPLMHNDEVIEAPVDQSRLTKRYTDRAVDFIRGHKDRPFFLYLPHTMPHVPQYASVEFVGKSKGGLYGDCVEELDWSTGIILDVLRELKLAERTLVIFTSDNGAPVAPKGAGKARSQRFPGRSLTGSNAPLRGGKGQTFEGGIRVPCIAWQPGRCTAGTVNTAPISHLDLFVTAARLAGAPLPEGPVYDGRDIRAELAGEKPSQPVPPIFHYFGPQLQAVRHGNWKLFVRLNSFPENRPYSLWFEHQPGLFEKQHRLLPEPELYDLSTDPGETQNVAAQHPEVVERLTKLADQHAAGLRKDHRPIEFVDGPAPPKQGAIRKE